MERKQTEIWTEPIAKAMGLFLLLIICANQQLAAQSFPIEKLLGYELLTTPQGESLRFLCSRKAPNTPEKKALFLFIPAQIEQPLFSQSASGYNDVLPFNHREYLDEFHFIVPALPQTPLVVASDSIPVKEKIITREEGFKNSTWKYIYQVERLIIYLADQAWVDSRTIVIAGYKDGGHLAARIAQRNPQVTHLIGLSMFPPDPATSPTLQEIQDACTSLYYLTKFTGKSLLAFGTEDPNASSYTPFLDVNEKSQNNRIDILPFSGLNASFAIIDPWGRDAPESYWQEVGRQVIAWAMSP
ncbi:MAG: hypothetical protein AAF694_05595 [Bacteroidota bacterium]